MLKLVLVRVAATASGVYGVLIFNAQPFAVTLEHDYTSGVKIPPGEYDALRDFYHAGGYETFEVQVPGHDRILLHKANYASDLDGCIGVGESFKEFGRIFGALPGIADSKAGFAELMSLLTGVQRFRLVVLDFIPQIEEAAR
jgi:hypothetical protein